ncbi:polyamine transporter TPO5 [Metarhizium album ARSEF 1941]|uniref:Polyamine transporter TPO5 n=1 Tax=Metarhizium album (strain ARSEF 1941) TaxID=1081103 RepID=A0A0B2X719_METAS|nr:polyamine transporter TPO5 [Metarhizium album ARSEF 1941]KHO01245.1 polyamine transporter TPO5 [Metarhizium album ARSEF 1941]
MEPRPATTPQHASRAAADADAALAGLGYKAELPRNLGMTSILGLSFAIMAVPFGLSTTLYITLYNGQSVAVLWGWVLVSLISVCIAASLAEMCAVYPTAGGVYYWSAMLSTRRAAPLVSFVGGWLTLVGNWTVTLSINFSGAQLVLSAVSLFDPDFAATPWQTVLCFWAVMLACAAVNALASRHLGAVNRLCVWWTGASVVVIVVTLLVRAPARRSPAFVFGHYDASASGWPWAWSFFVGLLQPAYTLTGYGMVAAMCEEVQNPERQVPRAMVLSVVAAGLTGVVYLVPLLFVMPDVAALLRHAQPIGPLFKTVAGSAGAGLGLLLLILGILLFAGVGALTAASRCTYAFARDGAVPGHRLWSRVHPRLGLPLWALGLSTLVDCLLGCIYLGSSAAFNSFTGVATICLSMSYGVPVLVLLLRRRRPVRASPFSLGRFGYAVNLVCVVWTVFAVVIFCMPVSLPVDPGSMNYASVVFAGFAAVAVAWYFAHARRNFHGPPILATDELVVTGAVADTNAPADSETPRDAWDKN